MAARKSVTAASATSTEVAPIIDMAALMAAIQGNHAQLNARMDTMDSRLASLEATRDERVVSTQPKAAKRVTAKPVLDAEYKLLPPVYGEQEGWAIAHKDDAEFCDCASPTDVYFALLNAANDGDDSPYVFWVKTHNRTVDESGEEELLPIRPQLFARRDEEARWCPARAYHMTKTLAWMQG